MKSIDLTQVVQDFLANQQLQDKHLLLMVSGGVDSIVLLEVMAQTHPKKKMHVLHINHKTSSQSEKNKDLVEKMCKTYDVNFYTDLQNLQKPEKTTASVENYWRKERKKYASQYAKKLGCKRVLTAHHATDLVETMIFRLTKGAGPSGLSPFNIKTKPLLKASKEHLIAYAKEKKITWIEDPSNNNNHHERNLIRNEVLPHLRNITPNLEKVFLKESALFADYAHYLDQQIPNTPSDLPLETFLELHKVLQQHWLYKIAEGKASNAEIQDVLKWLHHKPQGGSTKSIGDKQITLHAQTLTITNT